MKKLYFFMSLLVAATIFTSCSISTNDKENEPDVIELPAPAMEKEAVKYEIQDQNAEYKSIEFTASGNYIVLLNEDYRAWNAPARLLRTRIMTRANSYDDIIYGTYTKNSDGSYNLEGFGKVVITRNANGTAVKMSVQRDGKTTELTARIGKVEQNTSMTNNLCRTWRFEKVGVKIGQNYKTIYESEAGSFGELMEKMLKWMKEHYGNNLDDEDFVYDFDEDYEPELMIFTKSGSYLVQYSNQEIGISFWGWKDESKGLIWYSWTNDFDEEELEEESDVRVSFDSTGRLIMKESFVEGGSGAIFTYTMKEVK